MGNGTPGDTGHSKRSPLRIVVTAIIFIVVAILLAVFSPYLAVDQTFFILALVLVVGVAIFVQAARRAPKNKVEIEDEARTCTPLLDSYRKHKNVDTLLDDYNEWKSGEHSTYTRMHFGEQIIDVLRDVKRYESALSVLYEMDGLPFKAREHYDYDRYRTRCEAELLGAVDASKK